jgi:hypothetical protein
MATTQIKDGYNGGSDNQLKVNPDGSINVDVSGGSGGVVSTNLTQINGASISEGQKTMDNSLPVVIASNQSPLAIAGAITGTVSTNLKGLLAFQTSQYTVGTSATQLTVTPLTNRSSMSIKAVTTSSNDIVYVGNSNAVTNANGYPLFNGDSIQLDLTPAQAVWVIGTSAGQTVCVIEIGG